MFFDVVSGQIHPKILLKVVQNHTYPENIPFCLRPAGCSTAMFFETPVSRFF